MQAKEIRPTLAAIHKFKIAITEHSSFTREVDFIYLAFKVLSIGRYSLL